MDPITLIVAALAAGASAGALDALKDDVKDAATAAYGKLRDLVKRRFHGNASAEVILAEYQADPEAYKVPLTKKLTEAGAGDDAEILAVAKELMELVDPQGKSSGKFNVTFAGNAQGVVIGDHSTQTNTFNS